MASKKFDNNNLNESLKHYLNGSFNANERALFEAEMAKNEFLQNAYEGLKSAGLSVNDIEREKRQLKNQLKIKSNIYFKRGLMLLSAAAVVIFAIFILKNNPKKTELADVEKPKKIEEKINPVVKDSMIEKLELKTEIIEPKKEKTLPKKTIRKTDPIIQPKQKDTTILIANNNIDSVIKTEPIIAATEIENPIINNITSVKVEIPEFSNLASNNDFRSFDALVKGKKQKATKPEEIIPTYEFMVYDSLYADVLPKTEIMVNSVEAKFENKDSKSSLDKELKKEEIKYDDFIKSALEKLKKNQFEIAKIDFELILQQYKNDINALYYLGLCFYHLNNPSLAQSYFEKIEANENDFYKADAEWHLALVYGQLGDTEEMKQRLIVIKNKNNNYSPSASVRLEKMK